MVESGAPRLVSLDGVPIEAPLSGTLILMANEDKPGVIGDVGTALGRHGVNIATFALGRDDSGAVSVISVDETTNLDAALADIGKLKNVREASAVRL